MAYPGLALAVMVGVSIGMALYYFFADTPPQAQQGPGPGPNRQLREVPRSPWTPCDRNGDARRRRSDSKAKDSEKLECVICLTNLQNGTTRELNCGHRFHQPCIGQWLATQNSCPMCRRNA